MDFDPKAYLAANDPSAAPSGFDPKAYLAANDPNAPTGLESAARGVGQGASLGFGDELSGGGDALLDMLREKIHGRQAPSFSDAYTKHRDEARAANKLAEETNPTAFGAGKFGGNLASTAAAALATGGTSLGAQAALGAAGSGLQSLGDADKLDADALKSAAINTAVGGAAGAAGAIGGKWLSKGVNAATEAIAPKLAQKLDDLAIAQGRRVLTGGADSLTAKNALDVDAVRQALEDNAITYGGTTQTAAAKLEDLAAHAGEIKQGIVAQLEAKGVKNSEAKLIAEKWMADAQSTRATTLGSSAPGLMEKNAEELLGKLDLEGGASISGIEDMKTSAQGKAKYNALNPDTEGNKAWKGMASDLRQSNENSIAQAAAAKPDDLELQALNENFKPAKDRYGNLIEASKAARKGAEQAAKRNALSVRDTVAAGAMLAHGNIPGAIAAGGGSMLARKFGSSVVSRAAFDASKSLGRIGQVALTNPARLGQFGSILASAAARGPDALNATHFVLGQTSPEYQKKVQDLDGDGQPDEAQR